MNNQGKQLSKQSSIVKRWNILDGRCFPHFFAGKSIVGLANYGVSGGAGRRHPDAELLRRRGILSFSFSAGAANVKC